MVNIIFSLITVITGIICIILSASDPDTTLYYTLSTGLMVCVATLNLVISTKESRMLS